MIELNKRELEIALALSESQRKYADTLLLLLKAEDEILGLRAEIEKLKNPHGNTIPNFLERNWK